MGLSGQELHEDAIAIENDTYRNSATVWHSYKYFLHHKLAGATSLVTPTVVRTEESSHLVSIAKEDLNSFHDIRIELNSWCRRSRSYPDPIPNDSAATNALCSFCSRKFDELQKAVAAWPKSFSAISCQLKPGFRCQDHLEPAPAIEIIHKVWLPSALSLPEVMVVFPRVGLANRLFLYSFGRLAAMLLRKSFYLATEIRELHTWPSRIDYCNTKIESQEVTIEDDTYADLFLSEDEISRMNPFLPLLSTHVVFYSKSSKPCPPECSISLLDMLVFQGDVGRLYIQALHSCHITSSMVLRFAPLISSWMTSLAKASVTESMKTLPAFKVSSSTLDDTVDVDSVSNDVADSEFSQMKNDTAAPECPIVLSPRFVSFSQHDWVIHIRTGDIWIEDLKDDVTLPDFPTDDQTLVKSHVSHRVNSAYCPPPCWWYKEIAKEEKMKNVWLVSSSKTSTLTKNVALALLEGGVKTVHFVQGSQKSDFGLLMRARNLVSSCSSFAWWAAFLSQVVPIAQSVKPGSSHANSDVLKRKLIFPLTGLSNPVSYHATYHDLSFQRQVTTNKLWFEQLYYKAFVPLNSKEKQSLPVECSQNSSAIDPSWLPVLYPVVPLMVASPIVWHPYSDAKTLQHYSCSSRQRGMILSRSTPSWYNAGGNIVVSSREQGESSEFTYSGFVDSSRKRMQRAESTHQSRRRFS